MKYYFLLITILEADLRYNNNINNVAQNYLGQVSVSVSLFHRTLLGYNVEWMHANC